MDYKDVIMRLREERERMSWSQRKICQYISVSQTQYCKIESGSQYLSYDELNTLSGLGLDIYYIFTGHKGDRHYFREFESCCYIEIICLLEIIYSVILCCCHFKKADIWMKLHEEVCFIRLLDTSEKVNNNLFFRLRCLLDYTQIEMAELLNMDVKKLRKLEKGRCLPDSEVLWQSYNKFKIPPSILLKDRNGLLNEVDWLLGEMDELERNDILMMAKHYLG